MCRCDNMDDEIKKRRTSTCIYTCICGQKYNEQDDMIKHIAMCDKFKENGKWFVTKRKSQEWKNAILEIIKNNNCFADHNHLYENIPKIIHLNSWETRQSTAGANYEPVWRGTLRITLSNMVEKERSLEKIGENQDTIFSIPKKKKYVPYIPPNMTNILKSKKGTFKKC